MTTMEPWGCEMTDETPQLFKGFQPVDNVSEDDEYFEQPPENVEQTPKLDESTIQSEEIECSHCHVVQPRSEFYNTTNYWHQKRGCTYRCKTCCRKSAKESAAKKRQEAKEE